MTERILTGRRSPLKRYGGKGRIAHRLIPHFARAALYVEPFFGGGSVFYALPPGAYARHAVNDLDHSVVTFFRVLRDRPDDLLRVCALTPYAREEFRLALESSDDPLEEARRVWVRSRQGYAGEAFSVGQWGRSVASNAPWRPSANDDLLREFFALADRLRSVEIDSIDAAEFVARWASPDAFVYADPPYVQETRNSGRNYLHEMTDEDHARLAASLHEAAAKGARVAVSGYDCDLYARLFAGWRRVDLDVVLAARVGESRRRTECLWLSYGEEIQRDLFGGAR